MNIHQIRNATMLLTLGEHRLLVDPMLSEPGAFPGFKMFGGGRKANPLVALPLDAMEVFAQATGVLLTHEHPDHLDVPAIKWIKARNLPVWASPVDAPNLRKKGLDVHLMQDGALGMAVEVIPAQHGHGVMGWLMGPVSGFFLAAPNEPGVYITGDSVLTEVVKEAITRLKPEVIVAPAGAANFGLGRDILFSREELLELVRLAPGQVVFNHLESLDHCPTTREGLRALMDAEGLGERVQIPKDGQQISFGPALEGAPVRAALNTQTHRKPGFQKWLTAKFAGT